MFRFEPNRTVRSTQFLRFVFHLSLAGPVLNLPLLVLPAANPDIIFILLQSEDHRLQLGSVYDTKIVVEMDVLMMHSLVDRQDCFSKSSQLEKQLCIFVTKTKTNKQNISR